MKKSNSSTNQIQEPEIEDSVSPFKITNEDIIITLNFKERPITTSILLCFIKPDMGFILLAYCLVYIFIFYVIMLKCYEAYISTLSNLSPKTIERIDYIYNSFEFVINTTKSMFNFLYYKNNEIKRIENFT